MWLITEGGALHTRLIPLHLCVCLLSAPRFRREDSSFCFLSPPVFCLPCVFVSHLGYGDSINCIQKPFRIGFTMAFPAFAAADVISQTPRPRAPQSLPCPEGRTGKLQTHEMRPRHSPSSLHLPLPFGVAGFGCRHGVEGAIARERPKRKTISEAAGPELAKPSARLRRRQGQSAACSWNKGAATSAVPALRLLGMNRFCPVSPATESPRLLKRRPRPRLASSRSRIKPRGRQLRAQPTSRSEMTEGASPPAALAARRCRETRVSRKGEGREPSPLPRGHSARPALR